MKSALLLSAAALLVATSAFAGTAVPVGPFKSIELRGGGYVALHSGAMQAVTLNAGSTQFTKFHIEDGGKLVIDACNENCPHNYDLRIDIATPTIDAVAVQGGGEIMGSNDLHADRFSAAVDGGGQIKVFAGRSLNAAVSGGGHIQYWGTPQVSSAISGGGDVRQGS